MFDDVTEEEAVHSDILRVWDDDKALYPSEIAGQLPYIPVDDITKCLKSSPEFVRTEEGRYFLMSKFSITPAEREEIYSYVYRSCVSSGFAAIVNVPCDSVRANNSELTGDGIYTAIFNKVLNGHFRRNYKLITEKASELNIVRVFTNYCRGRSECSVSELSELAMNITDSVYMAGILNALYDCMNSCER